MEHSISGVATWILGRFPALSRFIQSIPKLNAWINGLAINSLVNSTAARPYPFSLWSADRNEVVANYVSWTGLVDRTYTGRHLPPAEDMEIGDPPPTGEVIDLFRRVSVNNAEQMIRCERSSTLFCFFAQWFTDSFLRTNSLDRRKNTSNHEIDLCQIYGLDAATARLLRTGSGGRLRTGENQRFAEHLYADGKIKPEFLPLPYVTESGKQIFEPLMKDVFPKAISESDRRDTLYATGLERGNSTFLYTAISTMFIREHNRICSELQLRYSDWKDDRLFETARNTNMVLLLRLIVEEYINHLAGTEFRFQLQRNFAEKQRWYRTNRISLEFDLLYRWHSLVPNEMVLDGQRLQGDDFRFNNAILEAKGVELIFDQASRQFAGHIGLFNTPNFLIEAEINALEMSRKFRLKPYNQYRERFSMAAYGSFDELTGDPSLSAKLEQLYGHVDRVELTVGLLAEQKARGTILPSLMRTMVGADAFSQALTNPLLAGNVWGERAFSELGLEIIDSTKTFKDIVERNKAPGSTVGYVSFDASQVPENSRIG
jgi:prostaglandin-endoperoxide synthase 2